MIFSFSIDIKSLEANNFHINSKNIYLRKYKHKNINYLTNL